jgi:hypothetical protein
MEDRVFSPRISHEDHIVVRVMRVRFVLLRHNSADGRSEKVKI